VAINIFGVYEMEVIIYCSDGEGQAEWVDECGVRHEEYLGEVSDNWLENEAEEYFGKMLGEDISLEVIQVDKGYYCF
jgi:hypothetical protein